MTRKRIPSSSRGKTPPANPKAAPRRGLKTKSSPAASGAANNVAPQPETAREATFNPFRFALRRAVLRRTGTEAGQTAAAPEAANPGPSATVRARPDDVKAAKAAVEEPSAAKRAVVSPLAPADFPILPPVAGVSLAAGAAGIRYAGRTDVLLAELAPKTAVAGVFTASRMPSAPVDWCRANMEPGRARALVVNSGNANAFTGRAGAEAAKATASACAKLLGCRQGEVFLASTGVIGEALPADRIVAKLPDLHAKASPDVWREAAEAIMTTDTFPKAATRTALIDGVEVRINGIAKGSGMIAPDLGTMLAFLFTDAAIPAEVLQTLLILEVRETFNAITVDSDTSTSDTVLLFATGRCARHSEIRRPGESRLRDFRQKLSEVMLDLAHQIVRDGEGATKFITVRVSGAATARAAKAIATSIANSPLVKTAVAGEDPNWGRVVMAVGKSGEMADRDKLLIRFGEHVVARDGAVDPAYDEKRVAAYMKNPEILIDVDIGVGGSAATVWTCDLTKRYIDINADYRS